MAYNYLVEIELDREDLVATLPCPVCGVVARQRCFFGRDKTGRRISQPTSHTGRYDAAAAAGLVPALPAVRHGF